MVFSRRLLRFGAAMLSVGLLAQMPAPKHAQAADDRPGGLVVLRPWSPPTPPAATVGVVYFSIANQGARADRLLDISSPVARKVEVHETRMEGGMVGMRPVTSVEVPAGSTVRSEPGGLHAMLIGLAHPLMAGTDFPLSLHFRDAGVIGVKVVVASRE